MKNIRDTQIRLRKKQISCVELTREYLGAIEKHNGGINAYITVTADRALETARDVDSRIAAGEELKPLEGIPMALKDNISTDGVLTTCASKMLYNYTPIYDATVWQKLKDQGAVLLGKNNMDEFAMGSSTETSYYGATVNPYHSGHVSGGSSGGTAAAVAGGMAVYGLGSDTGGSIRQPASFCGIVGLKPTYGAVSRYGLISYADSLDQIGPLTNCVEDAALVFSAIRGHDEKDSTSVPTPGAFAPSFDGDITGCRIGVIEEYYRDVAPSVQQAMQEAIVQFEAMGAKIIPMKMPAMPQALPAYYILACAEASSNLGRFDGIRYGYRTNRYQDIDEMICRTREEGFGAEVKRRIMLGTYVLSSGYYDAYYGKAQNLRAVIIEAFAQAFAQCDCILAPTVPRTAYPVGMAQEDPVESYKHDILTVPVNIAGLPALSLPCGYDPEGLPIGMQLIGNRFFEARILEMGYAFERLFEPRMKTCGWGVQ